MTWYQVILGLLGLFALGVVVAYRIQSTREARRVEKAIRRSNRKWMEQQRQLLDKQRSTR